jgi:hypothetical protein
MQRLVAASSLLLLMGAAPAGNPNARITSLEVKFFDPETASFGPDVLKGGLYLGWNTFLAEGNGGYGRGDALVLVNVARGGDHFEIAGPLTITALTKNKLLARRSFTRIDVSKGAAARALYLQDIGCAGKIEVRAKLGDQIEIGQLDMECGE